MGCQLCQEDLQKKIQAEQEKKRKIAIERWKRIVKKLTIRHHLKSRYDIKEDDLDRHAEKGDANSNNSENQTVVISFNKAAAQTGDQREHVEHTFGEERCVDQDLWQKTCTQCGFTLSFEKI